MFTSVTPNLRAHAARHLGGTFDGRLEFRLRMLSMLRGIIACESDSLFLSFKQDVYVQIILSGRASHEISAFAELVDRCSLPAAHLRAPKFEALLLGDAPYALHKLWRCHLLPYQQPKVRVVDPVFRLASISSVNCWLPAADYSPLVTQFRTNLISSSVRADAATT